MTADLVEFLRARLDEDERRAKRANPDSASVKDAVYRSPSCYSGDVVLVAAMNPARVLAEVEAKRQIIDEQTNAGGCQGHPRSWQLCADYRDYGDGYCRDYDGNSTLRWLALPYAEHPDYDEGWKP